MKTVLTLVTGASLLALLGCACDSTVESDAAVADGVALNTDSAARIAITTDWGTGYCAEVTMVNGLAQTAARWQIVIDLKKNVMTNIWGGSYSSSTGATTVTPASHNASIASGSSAKFNFCARAPNSSMRPTISAWNMESSAYATCTSNSGIFPTKAALAVAMATELGRWDPLKDLTISADRKTILSSTGSTRCSDGCKNIKAILGQQDTRTTAFVDQSTFNPTSLREDLVASFDRQRTLIADLTNNSPARLPPNHKLTLLGGPTDLGIGSCGPHYIFQVDNADGTALTSTQAANVANALCYFGHGGCGGNAYLSFAQVTAGCPSGRTCVAIDPTDGDNSTTSTTTAGSAPTYPFNRVYDPTNSLIGAQCITVKGKLGTLVSKCSTLPFTCGFLYCIAQ